LTDYLLDTSIIRSLFIRDTRVTSRLDAMRPTDSVSTSVITQGELLYGAARTLGARRHALEELMIEFFSTLSQVWPVTTTAASAYAAIKDTLAATGRMIPANDLWIAAIALSGGLTLVAHDEHFTRVGDLPLEDWLED